MRSIHNEEMYNSSIARVIKEEGMRGREHAADMEGNRTLWEESHWIMYVDTKFIIIFKENFINLKEKERN